MAHGWLGGSNAAMFAAAAPGDGTGGVLIDGWSAVAVEASLDSPVARVWAGG